MIEIVEGRGVGSGKSYYVCERIIAHLSVGGTVYATDTFGLKWEATRALVELRFGVVIEDGQYQVFTREDVHRLHEITPQGTAECPVLIVLDECHMELNSRDWNEKGKRAFFDWLTQSRHDDCDLIFISQSALNIDNQIRRLVTYIIRTRNMANFSFPGIGKWPLKQFVQRRFDQDGKTLLSSKWTFHDVAIFGCYDSKVMRGAHKRLGITIPKRRLQSVNRTSKPMGKILLVVIVLALGGGYYCYGSFSKRKAEEKEKERERIAARVIPSQPVGGYKAPSALFDVVTEMFRGTDGRTYLRTDSATYRVGEMSGRGLVEGMKGHVVKIRTPSAGLLYVVADEFGSGVPGSADTKEVTQSGGSATGEGAVGMERVRAGLPATQGDDTMERVRAGLPARERGEVHLASQKSGVETSEKPAGRNTWFPGKLTR